jgi:hypothetical protein
MQTKAASRTMLALALNRSGMHPRLNAYAMANSEFRHHRVAATRGEYQLSVRVGYGTVPAPEPPTVGEGAEAPVLRWQHEAVSKAARMVV